jgi:hypothetical protein
MERPCAYEVAYAPAGLIGMEASIATNFWVESEQNVGSMR